MRRTPDLEEAFAALHAQGSTGVRIVDAGQGLVGAFRWTLGKGRDPNEMPRFYMDLSWVPDEGNTHRFGQVELMQRGRYPWGDPLGHPGMARDDLVYSPVTPDKVLRARYDFERVALCRHLGQDDELCGWSYRPQRQTPDYDPDLVGIEARTHVAETGHIVDTFLVRQGRYFPPENAWNELPDDPTETTGEEAADHRATERPGGAQGGERGGEGEGPAAPVQPLPGRQR